MFLTQNKAFQFFAGDFAVSHQIKFPQGLYLLLITCTSRKPQKTGSGTLGPEQEMLHADGFILV